MSEHVLVIGGAGYIGSHTCLVLLQRGMRVTVLDNLSTGSRETLDEVQAIAGRTLALVEGDIRDRTAMAALLAPGRFDSVIHFAALKDLTESLQRPLDYYDVNVGGMAIVLDAMQQAGVRKLVFSSSAAVYGTPAELPLTETAPLRGTSAYAATKRIGEEMLQHLCAADPRWRSISLRYFNPVGAHESARIGERMRGAASNLMPAICRAATGQSGPLNIYRRADEGGDDSGVRDFIHVMDLAEVHAVALDWLGQQAPGTCLPINVGTGRGHSALEMIHSFEAVNGVSVPRQHAPARPGEVPVCFADATRAHQLLQWRASRDLESMCADAWRWTRAELAGREPDPALGIAS